MQEIFKDIPGYEGLYKVSNLGRVYSLRKTYPNGQTRRPQFIKTHKLKGYEYLGLSKDGKRKTITMHQLVAMAFLNHTPNGHSIVVDHINHKKDDNRLSNLQLISNRENCSRSVKNKTSKYTGVSWSKDKSKWVAQIVLNGKTTALGRFHNEVIAHLAYEQALSQL